MSRATPLLPLCVSYGKCPIDTRIQGYDNLRFCSINTAAMQGRQLTRQALHCNITVRRVRASIVAAEKQYVLHILSVCVRACLRACVRACVRAYV
jgi:hypothetical protein